MGPGVVVPTGVLYGTKALLEEIVNRREFLAMATAAGAAGAFGDASGYAAPLPEIAELPRRPDMPDPLVMLSGARVSDRHQWEKERRPELRRLFQHYMYGYLPPRPRSCPARVERVEPQYLGGKATKREVYLTVGPAGTRPIHVLLLLPSQRRGRVPVFVGLAFCGNHAVVDDPAIPISDAWMRPGEGVVNGRAVEASRGSAVHVWNVAKIIERGYGIATFYYGDVEPDSPDATEGLRARLADKGAHACGAIGAWAWGIHRVVDYLVRQPAIDTKRIAVVGHSRNGKAALLAAAMDDRIALAIPSQAGCGGTAPSRGTVGESVKQINTAFPHWFCPAFREFNDRTDRLPFDQNCLTALMAPRPVLFPNATEDLWANPAGQLDVLRATDGVYRLLGVEELGEPTPPPVGKLLPSRLGYFIRPGKHSMTSIDWDAFLDYADVWLALGGKDVGNRA